MRELHPPPAGVPEVDAVDAYVDVDRVPPPGRPWVAVNMVASVDGATALAGRSGGLGGPADREVFQTLRAAADVVMVGSGTFTAERYGPPRLAAGLQELRRERGRAGQPRIAVVTGRLGLDLTTPFFTESPNVPIVVTVTGAAPQRREAAAAVAEVVECGPGPAVDVRAALAALGDLGAGVVVCEGGPSLNADLVAADLVDEICLSVAPMVAGGHSKAIFGTAALADPPRFHLGHVLEADDGYLFLRYLRAR